MKGWLSETTYDQNNLETFEKGTDMKMIEVSFTWTKGVQ